MYCYHGNSYSAGFLCWCLVLQELECDLSTNIIIKTLLVQLPEAGSSLKNVNRQLDGSGNMIPVDLTWTMSWTIVDSFSLYEAYRFHLFVISHFV